MTGSPLAIEARFPDAGAIRRGPFAATVLWRMLVKLFLVTLVVCFVPLSVAGCSEGASPSGDSNGGAGLGGGDTGASAGTGHAGQPSTQDAAGTGGGMVSGAGGAANGDAGSTADDGASGTTTTDASVGAIDGGGASDAGDAADTDAGDWRYLFNCKDLTGWIPSPGCEPIYATDTLSGEGVIHVYPTQPDQSNQPKCTLRTTESFSGYVYHEEYKWGVHRFSDRKQTYRDNGICFHLCNTLTQVWPDSIEFQIGASPLGGDYIVGDIFVLGATRADWTYTSMSGRQVYSENGMQMKVGTGGPTNRGRVGEQRNSDTDWNVLELTVHGAKDAEYNVNGKVVNRLLNMECNTGGSWKALDSGPIALQAEFAEVYFRNVKIKVLQ